MVVINRAAAARRMLIQIAVMVASAVLLAAVAGCDPIIQKFDIRCGLPEDSNKTR